MVQEAFVFEPVPTTRPEFRRESQVQSVAVPHHQGRVGFLEIAQGHAQGLGTERDRHAPERQHRVRVRAKVGPEPQHRVPGDFLGNDALGPQIEEGRRRAFFQARKTETSFRRPPSPAQAVDRDAFRILSLARLIQQARLAIFQRLHPLRQSLEVVAEGLDFRLVGLLQAVERAGQGLQVVGGNRARGNRTGSSGRFIPELIAQFGRQFGFIRRGLSQHQAVEIRPRLKDEPGRVVPGERRDRHFRLDQTGVGQSRQAGVRGIPRRDRVEPSPDGERRRRGDQPNHEEDEGVRTRLHSSPSKSAPGGRSPGCPPRRNGSRRGRPPRDSSRPAGIGTRRPRRSWSRSRTGR